MHQLKLVKEKERKTFANMFDKVSTTHQSQSALKLKERREKPHAISNMCLGGCTITAQTVRCLVKLQIFLL